MGLFTVEAFDNFDDGYYSSQRHHASHREPHGLTPKVFVTPAQVGYIRSAKDDNGYDNTQRPSGTLFELFTILVHFLQSFEEIFDSITPRHTVSGDIGITVGV